MKSSEQPESKLGNPQYLDGSTASRIRAQHQHVTRPLENKRGSMYYAGRVIPDSMGQQLGTLSTGRDLYLAPRQSAIVRRIGGRSSGSNAAQYQGYQAYDPPHFTAIQQQRMPGSNMSDFFVDKVESVPNVTNRLGSVYGGAAPHSTMGSTFNQPGVKIANSRPQDEDVRKFHQLKMQLEQRDHEEMRRRKISLVLDAINDKPFACPVCNERFRVMDNLRSHVKAGVHNKSSATNPFSLRPFVCPLCNKSFDNKYNLKRHMMIHTGEKPFECKSCGKRFNQRSTLLQHQKRMHREGTSKMHMENRMMDTSN
eukprot:CAMPEP_0114505948 /NCGR_PEP_ID=MMETSP0109-20121206/11144_1 /TAXON_ID=29199 /ORGANISM="Chlorarachnion reptans, Strain CCCM449" /LENGTH=310 /DNA_ID=CAMNT_0001684459 /DNA_START=32 /DNA_END=964 /DNA_ORIENTATION=-